MKRKAIKLLCLLLAAGTASTAFSQTKVAALSIIPQPQRVTTMPGSFRITAKSKIVIPTGDAEMKRLAADLVAEVKYRTGLILPVVTSSNQGNSIYLVKAANGTVGTEGYKLTVTSQKVTISAPQYAGLFYGIQTINKLLPATPVSGQAVNLPAVSITDYPRFEWRGLMLDVGRYYYPVSFIKRYIDYMAQNKLNVFHWHLVEDGGWRIEIKKYPKLTTVGSKRTNTQIHRNPAAFDGVPHRGFYTQDEVRDVVAYAAKRFVTIVPEIEMPGHTMSSLAAYPELSCTGGPFDVPYEWKIRPDIYCSGNEQTFKFLEDVLTEVTALFPGKYFHIGGDEAPKDRWKVCPKCQARIKAEGLKDEHELQSYFIKRIEKFLATKNKSIIGWDEILEGGLAPNAAVMSWRGIKGGIAAAQQHHNVIMSPNTYMYFDYYQGDPALEPFAIGGNLTLDKVYNYEPAPQELTADEAKYIKGVQANVWEEYIHSPDYAEYMTWPRASAMAEVAWTNPGNKNWDVFKQKLEQEYKRFDADGINYSASAYNPVQQVKMNESKQPVVSLYTNAWNGQVHYTVDGSEPTASSQLYSQPFVVSNGTVIKSVVFTNGKPVGKVLSKTVEAK